MKTKIEPCKKCGHDVKKTPYLDPMSKREKWGYCCNHCHAENIKRHRKSKLNFKKECLQYLNVSSCSRCGYSKNLAALHFHHKNPNDKQFSISRYTHLSKLVKSELSKCTVLCANCHIEIENPSFNITANNNF